MLLEESGLLDLAPGGEARLAVQGAPAREHGQGNEPEAQTLRTEERREKGTANIRTFAVGGPVMVDRQKRRVLGRQLHGHQERIASHVQADQRCREQRDRDLEGARQAL